MQDTIKELKQHPDFWKLHKRIWTEEYNNLNREIAAEVMNNPDCTEAKQMNRKVFSRVESSLLHCA